MIYKYLPEHLFFMREQIFECRDNLEIYSQFSAWEYEQTKDYIGSPKIVLDLGCGLGRAAIYLNWMLVDSDIHYIMADRDEVTPILLSTTKNCTMIFGTRNRALYSKESYISLFKEVLFLEYEEVKPYPQQDWLILKKKLAL